ncbi:hypothetical protein Phum_PHUM291660 [Pediculus humanus corporis]|uniref:Uncharacterized protein n=1 Tax=Pediculus humanus subsp. corporis TaxID=121224 RepID=E0VLQ0_PEDHC|nr:uncharacterized protein Phum_PHUM291660 [Pediculus humanus corporis]EEB14306.1 hypothetical protein Phum_PHUM291660 [Pediculus humanus corporis]
MSEVDSNIPTSSPTSEVIDSVSNFSDGSCTPSESLTSSQSDKIDVNKSSGSSVSKIARPTGLKLPSTAGTAVTSSSRIARLCNNASKPALPTTNTLQSIDI